MTNQPEYVLVGVLSGSHGLSGFFKLVEAGESWKFLKPPFPLTIQKNNTQKSFQVCEFTIHPNYILVQVEGIKDPEFWKQWKGAKVFMEKSLLAQVASQLETNSYFYYQLIGLEAINDQKEKTGFTVKSVLDNPAHPILELERENHKVYIPFVSHWIGSISLEENTIHIHRWEDWFEV